MRKISTQAEERISSGIQKFQPILRSARLSNKNESDTVTIITDMLSDVFGYNKYDQLTSELSIKRTFCDLAVRLDGQLRLLIECKAIGVDLREEHIMQATNYAANTGVDYVVLTNGAIWQVYQVLFGKPVERVLLSRFDFCELSANQPADYDILWPLCVEAFTAAGNAAMEAMVDQRQSQSLSPYIVGRVLLNDWMIRTIRGSLQRHFPDIKISNDEVYAMLRNEVFRPEIVEGPSADEAERIVSAANTAMKERQAQGRKK
jgi:hypothetical protein